MIDLLYLCHGRIEFTEVSLASLLKTTNWDLVDNFVVYNDAATDMHETTKLLQDLVSDLAQIRCTNMQSPVGVMNHFLWRSEATMFAKIDNDIMVPPGWLEAGLGVMDQDPKLELLGMAAGMSLVPSRRDDPVPDCYTYTPCTNIGGVGLMRRSAFDIRAWPRPNGRFGFTEWQHQHQPVRGWIEPDLRVFEIDKLPFDPWYSITKDYKTNGDLQRDWPPYPEDSGWYWEWANLEGAA